MSVDFEPKIVAFLCWKWGYGAADMAGTIRGQYPASIRPIRVLCTARVSSDNIMRAFGNGADGVLIGGWHIGECNFVNGNEYAQKLVAYNQEIMESIGLEKDRLQIIFVSAAEGERFKNLCTDLDRKIRSLGPNPIKPIRKSILEAEAKKAAAKKAKEQAK